MINFDVFKACKLAMWGGEGLALAYIETNEECSREEAIKLLDYSFKVVAKHVARYNVIHKSFTKYWKNKKRGG